MRSLAAGFPIISFVLRLRHYWRGRLSSVRTRFERGAAVCLSPSGSSGSLYVYAVRGLCAEDAIAGVTEPGNDVAMLVQVIVNGGCRNAHIGKLLVHFLYSFR